MTADIKQEVRQFYDQVGWSRVGDDLYQNARYEDLRPVAREYIHRCHLRVSRHLDGHTAPPHLSGRFLLDAGSGPIQYPEYVEYSRNYQYRVCADISITALIEARKRLQAIYPEGKHGLFVVADIANLPFKEAAFDGVVSLHTIHHLPEDEHLQAYLGLHRLLAPGRNAVVVNGWPSSPLMASFEPLVRLSNRLRSVTRRLSSAVKRAPKPAPDQTSPRTAGKAGRANQGPAAGETQGSLPDRKGTFTSRHDVAWMKNEVGGRIPLEILVWRSASVRFMRAVIFSWLGGRYWLRLLFRLEERSPHYYGENGQYPLIVIRKAE
jgi:SAM-dependent methyltransferase